MFTGIIEHVGKVKRIDDRSITIESVYTDLNMGESIAVDGVCLTVNTTHNDIFSAHVSEETISKTTFLDLKKGSNVHLERALTPTSRMGGHIVQGHIDGVGEITRIIHKEQSRLFEITIPEALLQYVALKGSVALDGISLTIADLKRKRITVVIIPHTLAQTHWNQKKIGSKVNIETDILAKYVERQGKHAAMGDLFQKKELNCDLLVEEGFE